jgi:2-polyprenyl-3-methyl-5-hydroxy-6-metoxy-1,4-benzoquinol methylase
MSEFESKVYNNDYILVDPHYLSERPRSNAIYVQSTIGDSGRQLRHLDYGGGEGLLSRLLCDAGWNSRSYDPFVDKNVKIAELGRFELITAYEVFEHVPDPCALIDDLSSLLVEDGVIMFSTLLSDGNIHHHQRLSWWYVSPRNGHISIFSQRSLSLLAERKQFLVGGNTTGFHAMWRTIPWWAKNYLR